MPAGQTSQRLAAPVDHPKGQGRLGQLGRGGLELLATPRAIPEPRHLTQHQAVSHRQHQQVQADHGRGHHASGHQPLGALLQAQEGLAPQGLHLALPAAVERGQFPQLPPLPQAGAIAVHLVGQRGEHSGQAGRLTIPEQDLGFRPLLRGGQQVGQLGPHRLGIGSRDALDQQAGGLSRGDRL